ncbi:hypothetical protein LWC34_05950 [Kibdelosporangium philippinense]|uniref:Tetratricopeptide repeat protein n=1 Tax=Kibdelosporangium philippinense TaxID=211113 RepID=A0ABS8Z3G3_9PSEU|nr:hypothetical protein [Kibdelosporangium philippinense]MCE7002375.1 hypothetical protein [Kibdelosporangium philippinense]
MSFEKEVRAAFRRGDSAEVLRMAGAEVERARAAGDPAGEVEALYAMSRVAVREDDLPHAEQLASQALAVAVRTGDKRLEERPRHVLAGVTRLSGNLTKARRLYKANIELNESLGQDEIANSEYHNLAFTELRLGNVARARELFEAGRARVFQRGYDSFVPYVCVAAAALATVEGDHFQTVKMVGLTDKAYAAIGEVPDPDDAIELENARTAAIQALGESRFEQAYAAGATLEPAEAFGLSS